MPFNAVRLRLCAIDPYMRTLYAVNTIGLVSGTMYGLYYGIFLYRHTFSLSVLAIDGLMSGVGTYIGYVCGIFAVRRYGYNWCIRLAFVLWTLTCLATALISQHIAEWFVIIAVCKALPGGLYSATADTIMLREIPSGARSGFFQLNLAIEFMATMVMPSAVGALIHFTGGYNWAFVGAAGVYGCGLLVGTRLPKPQLQLDLRGCLSLFRRPLYRTHALNRTVAGGMNQLNAFALTIIPFLLLKNELSMGLLSSAGAVLAAAIAFTARRMKRKQALRAGYGAHGVRTLAAVAFAGIWTAPLMAAWQLVGKLMTPLHDPVQQGIDIQNDSLILGAEARRHALHINLVNNSLALIGTTGAFGLFLLLLRAGHTQQRSVLQHLLVVYALWRIVNFSASAAINRWAHHDSYYIPVQTRLHFLFSMQLSRLRAYCAKRYIKLFAAG